MTIVIKLDRLRQFRRTNNSPVYNGFVKLGAAYILFTHCYLYHFDPFPLPRLDNKDSSVDGGHAMMIWSFGIGSIEPF
jgi:hypothetical protein